jgi:P-type Ca2+ transporter type 2B
MDPYDYSVMEGKTFRELVQLVDSADSNTKEVKDLLTFTLIESKLRVLARSSPEDKYALVTGLIQLGRVVAVTGDGTNDAPALKKADIGFAMGISGTRVAQEAAGIILLDDNFSSIITACKWGRNVYDSIRKFLQFQLTVNLVALFMAFLGGVVVKKSPLNSIQMLWVNLIMDTLASLALATEPPNDELLKRFPYSRTEYIITGSMWRNIIGQAIYQIALLTLILFHGPQMFDVPNSYDDDGFKEETAAHFTIFFNTFVFMQIFNELNCRKIKSNEYNIFKGFFNNYLFLFIEFFTFGVQILLVTFGGEFVKVCSLTVVQHFYCVAIGAGTLVFGLLMKLIPERLFDHVPLFKDQEPIRMEDMDLSITSVLKRKASSRLYHHNSSISSRPNHHSNSRNF